jgi:tRNA (mo5U34)-methyltransferase
MYDPAPVPAASQEDIREQVAARREWYHTMELAPGVVTPGWFDTRAVARTLPFPQSLTGQRCLDIATFDGFWAFEMERRGADEVIAVDILDPMAWDWPDGATEEVIDAMERRKEGGKGFEIARDALGSSVERIEKSVYDLDPDDVGQFDFVYLGSLLMHLRDPVRALGAVRRVCRGSLLVVDNVDQFLTLIHPRRAVAELDGISRPWWWRLNLAGLVRVLASACFELTMPPHRFRMPAGPGQSSARPPLAVLRHRSVRQDYIRARWGDPHVALSARPSGNARA